MHATLNYKTKKEPFLTSLGLCLRVIVDENPLNLEKTTSCVLSVLLGIYDKNNLKKISQSKEFKDFPFVEKNVQCPRIPFNT